jgi:hypothetical protein
MSLPNIAIMLEFSDGDRYKSIRCRALGRAPNDWDVTFDSKGYPFKSCKSEADARASLAERLHMWADMIERTPLKCEH